MKEIMNKYAPIFQGLGKAKMETIHIENWQNWESSTARVTTYSTNKTKPHSGCRQHIQELQKDLQAHH